MTAVVRRTSERRLPELVHGGAVDVDAECLSLRQIVLVLDNCEHMLDAAAQLCAAVLSSADDVRILATSREPIPAVLALPDRDTPERAVEAEAVTLFAERARQVDPDFTLNGDAGSMVARLVQRLDGMPLAIELWSARVCNARPGQRSWPLGHGCDGTEGQAAVS